MFMFSTQVLKSEMTSIKELDIDIRADGGYVVAPPSIHGSGNQYAMGGLFIDF